MKPNKYSYIVIAVLVVFSYHKSIAQEDSVVAESVVKLHYYNNNNSLQYLLLESNLKKGKLLTPQANKTYQLFLDSSSNENLIATLKTDVTGKAKAFIPPTLKTNWDGSSKHLFIVKEGDEEVVTDYSIIKSKITIDTASADGVKTITATVMKLENSEWVPAKEVEMKIGMQRQGAILSAGDEETYTTDSTGTVAVEVTKNNLPGDEKGNILLVAKVDDNEELGNLVTEKKVSWGVPTKPDNNFFEQRTLWTTRFRTPVWLLLMAYSIVIGVWGTLIYLVVQIVKIKKIGTA